MSGDLPEEVSKTVSSSSFIHGREGPAYMSLSTIVLQGATAKGTRKQEGGHRRDESKPGMLRIGGHQL